MRRRVRARERERGRAGERARERGRAGERARARARERERARIRTPVAFIRGAVDASDAATSCILYDDAK